jgi:hypothetical protein
MPWCDVPLGSWLLERTCGRSNPCSLVSIVLFFLLIELNNIPKGERVGLSNTFDTNNNNPRASAN